MKKRDRALDLFKGILTILMIFTHVLGMFDFNIVTSTICFYVNLTTFSGFMFSFGYVSYGAYISKKKDKWSFGIKMIGNFLKTVLAFYISGIAYSLLVADDLSFVKLIRIIMFLEIPEYSEFLLSFAFMYLIIYIFKNIFNKMSNKTYLILSIISLLMTFINYDTINVPIFGVFVGTTMYYCFPIAQYFSYYLGGLYLAKNNIVVDKKIYLLTLGGTLIFIIYSIFSFSFPSRFPPSIYWVIGGYVFIYIYYVFCKKVRINKIMSFISKIGENTLSYLVISNIIIFTAYRIIKHYNILLVNFGSYLILYIILFILCIFIPYIYNYLIHRKKKI